MTLDMFIWDYSRHCFLFTSSVVFSVKWDFYPPGISFTETAGNCSANGLRSFGALWSPVSCSSPWVTRSLFFNLKHCFLPFAMFLPLRTLAQFHTVCRAKGIALATIFLTLLSALQVKPSPTISLGCSLPFGCTGHLSSLAHVPVLNPYLREPDVFYSDFRKIKISMTAYLSHSCKHIIEYCHVELNYSNNKSKTTLMGLYFVSSGSISIS